MIGHVGAMPEKSLRRNASADEAHKMLLVTEPDEILATEKRVASARLVPVRLVPVAPTCFLFALFEQNIRLAGFCHAVKINFLLRSEDDSLGNGCDFESRHSRQDRKNQRGKLTLSYHLFSFSILVFFFLPFSSPR